MQKLPWLGCKTNGPNQCCGDRMYSCGDTSAMRYSPAGPAVLTHEWSIGERSCAGNLKKCVGKCGNAYCSMDGKCGDSTIPYVRELFSNYSSPTSVVGIY